jgi:hypothetical protein
MSLEDELAVAASELENAHQRGEFKRIRDELRSLPQRLDQRAVHLAAVKRSLDTYAPTVQTVEGVPAAAAYYDACNHYQSVERDLYATCYAQLTAIHEAIITGTYDDTTKQQLTVVQHASNHLDDDLDSVATDLTRIYDDITSDEASRFATAAARRRYDMVYHDILKSLDTLTPNDLGNLPRYEQLAARSHDLIHKYRAIDDDIGEEHALKLHERVEDNAERLAPIKHKWRKQQLTVAALILAGIIGFWKGSFIHDYIDDFIVQHSAQETPAKTVGYELRLNTQTSNASLIQDDDTLETFPFVRHLPRGTYTIQAREIGKNFVTLGLGEDSVKLRRERYDQITTYLDNTTVIAE